jgi:transcriptional regulator with XRE-family HTH domain
MTVKTLDQMIGSLSPQRREKIAERTKQLIAEEYALRRMREARGLTQVRIAELMHIRQDSVSRLESRSDLLLSTLKSYVQAMGGSLRLTVEFPDGVAAELSSLGEPCEPDGEPPRSQRRGSRRLTLAHTNSLNTRTRPRARIRPA